MGALREHPAAVGRSNRTSEASNDVEREPQQRGGSPRHVMPVAAHSWRAAATTNGCAASGRSTRVRLNPAARRGASSEGCLCARMDAGATHRGHPTSSWRVQLPDAGRR
eukprot:3580739-Alexandrium_andersonii.AAC.1